MAQNSRPISNHTDNYPNSDAGPYSGLEWEEYGFYSNTGDENTSGLRTQLRGVVPTVWDKLVVTTSTTDAVVDNGAAWCGGALFIHDPNDAPTGITFDLSGESPANNRRDTVVVVRNNQAATYNTNLLFPTVLTDYDAASAIREYTTRLAVLTGPDDGTVLPRALVQNDTVWMIPLAYFTVPAGGGNLTSLSDQRQFAQIENIVGAHSNDNTSDVTALVIGAEIDDAGSSDDGFGVRIQAQLEDDGGTFQDAGAIAITWNDASAGTENSQIELRTEYIANEVLSGVIVAPDTASADGNARGSGSVDLQGYRSAVTQVASGANSVIGGGRENTVSSINSVVCGGNGNSVTSGNSVVCGGDGNSATTSNAAVCGGLNNTAAGTYSFVGCGSGNTANASYSAIGSGIDNDIALGATYATIPGGERAYADKYGQVVAASGRFAADGDAQGTIQMVARAATAGGGAATTLYLDGGSAPQRMTIPADSAWTYDILVVAMRQNAATVHSSRAYGVIYRDNANNTTLASATGVTVEQAGGGTTTVTADDANEALQIQFTDDGANVYRAVATIRLAEVTYP